MIAAPRSAPNRPLGRVEAPREIHRLLHIFGKSLPFYERVRDMCSRATFFDGRRMALRDWVETPFEACFASGPRTDRKWVISPCVALVGLAADVEAETGADVERMGRASGRSHDGRVPENVGVVDGERLQGPQC